MASTNTQGHQSGPPGPPSEHKGPSKSRTFVACLNCRRLKAKCVQSENPPSSACTRCRTRNITCEYPLEYSPHEYGYVPPQSQAQMYAPYYPQQPVAPGQSLPYTGPPSPYMRPRYSDGVPYPDLGLAAGGQGRNAQPQYVHPSQLAYPGGSQYAPGSQWPYPPGYDPNYGGGSS